MLAEKGTKFARCEALKLHWACPSCEVIGGRRSKGNEERSGCFLAACLPLASECISLASGNARCGLGKRFMRNSSAEAFCGRRAKKNGEFRTWLAWVVVFCKRYWACVIWCARF